MKSFLQAKTGFKENFMSGVTPHHSRLFLRLREVIMCLEILQSTTSVLWTVLCHQSLAAAREANIVVREDRVLIRSVSVISLMTVEITLTKPTVIIISLGKMLILQLSKLRSNCWIRLQPRWITSSEICKILHILGKPNSITVLLFIQNVFKFRTSLPPRRLSSNPWSISRYG